MTIFPNESPCPNCDWPMTSCVCPADDIYETCDCEWTEEEGTKPCGCGNHEVRLYRDEVIHWRDKHWLIECAFSESIKPVPAPECLKCEKNEQAIHALGEFALELLFAMHNLDDQVEWDHGEGGEKAEARKKRDRDKLRGLLPMSLKGRV